MSDEPILALENVTKSFNATVSGKRVKVHAVRGVSLSMYAGRTLGLVGETGCGKSTVARLAVALTQPTSGRVVFGGRDLATVGRRQLRGLRPEIQIVFQDPSSSLNPRRTIRQILAAAFELHGRAGPDLDAKLVDLATSVGLGTPQLERYPRQLSGGQRQRVGIARALSLNPRIIICDEPVSALDVSIQAQILNLFRALQRARGLAYLFISHDLRVVRHMADVIAVMYLGKIVELGPADVVYERPVHPYTQALLSAVPDADTGGAGLSRRIVLGGDVPSPITPPSGCPLHNRCALARAMSDDTGRLPDRCVTEMPPLTAIAMDHRVACWYATIPDRPIASADGVVGRSEGEQSSTTR